MSNPLARAEPEPRRAALLSASAVHVLVLAGAGLWVSIYPIGVLLGNPGVPEHDRLFFVAFVGYLAAVALVLRPRAGNVRPGLVLILLFAVLWRLAMLLTTPGLSGDVYRYVWDGKLVNAGIDPYLYPPDAPQLAGLRDQIWERMGSHTQPSPYPPLAQAIFAAAYRLEPDSVAPMQIAAAGADLLAIGAVLLLLRARGQDLRRVAVYAWSPLVLAEFSHSAHYDAWMIASLVAALVLAQSRRPVLSGGVLALGVLAKLLPVLFVPLLLRRWGVRGLAAFAGVVVAGLLPFLLTGGTTVLNGVSVEAEAEFNDSLFLLLTRAAALLVPNPADVARLVVAGIVVLIALVIAARAAPDFVDGAFWLLAVYLALAAVVEPWYLTWLLPFVAVRLSAGRRFPLALGATTGWLLLSGLVRLSDLTYGDPPMLSWPLVRAVEYVPLYGLVLFSVYRRVTSDG